MTVLSVLTSLVSVIVFQRLTKKLIISMIAGFLAFAFVNWQVISHFPMIFLNSLRDSSFITLLPSVFLIYFLGELMAASQDAERFSQSVQKLFQSSKSAAAFMPAVVGLMPMPAGAMFTAPIVDQIGSQMNALDKTAVNYWFRHTLEFFWPVYPAMYLLASLTGTPLGMISIKLFPLFLISFLIGWLYLNGFTLPKVRKISSEDWKNLWPLLVILSTGFMILVFKLEGWLSLLIACGFYALVRARAVLKALVQSVKKLDIFPILLVVFLYKHSMIDLGIGQRMSEELSRSGFGVLLIAISLPLVIGMSTGITGAALGVCLPIVLAMKADHLAVITYVFSVIGVLLSPVHLCLVLTCQYFKMDFLHVLRRVLVPIIVTSIAGLLLYSW